MEAIIELAREQNGLDDDYDAKATVGSFLQVLEQSPNLGVRFNKLLKKIDGGAQFMALHQKGEFFKKVTNSGQLKSSLTPPTPPVIVLGKAIHKSQSKDKDGFNTYTRVVELMDKRQIARKDLEAFMPVFGNWAANETGVESARTIVHMPPQDPTPLHGIKTFVANALPT